jgi:hypothetical protein
MKDPKVFHSLTRWWCAVLTIDDMSRISQVRWKTRNYSIHLFDDDVLLQHLTICPQYHRLNERPPTISFTYSMMMCCSNKRRYVHNITGEMKEPVLFHSLTRWWCAVPTRDDMSTISHVKWKTRWYSIHSLDDDVLFQQQTMCSQ